MAPEKFLDPGEQLPVKRIGGTQGEGQAVTDEGKALGILRQLAPQPATDTHPVLGRDLQKLHVRGGAGRQRTQ